MGGEATSPFNTGMRHEVDEGSFNSSVGTDGRTGDSGWSEQGYRATADHAQPLDRRRLDVNDEEVPPHHRPVSGSMHEGRRRLMLQVPEDPRAFGGSRRMSW